MNNVKLFLPILGFILSACDDAKNQAPVQIFESTNVIRQETKASTPGVAVPSPNFEIIKIEEKTPDPAHELGSWDKTLAYPKLIGPYSETLKAQVNSEIERSANAFKCSGNGDQAFTATVTHATDKLFSFKYEAMHMCAKSPRPSSKQGAYTYNMQTGKLMDLDSEFMDPSTKNDFTAMATKRLNEGVAKEERETEMECPKPIDIGYFFVTSTGVAVAYRADDHYYSACTTEVEISKEALRRYLKPDSLLLN